MSDGKTLLYRLRNLINESSTSAFLDSLTTYDFLNEAAIEFIQRTKILRATQTITTVKDQSDYTLNADFLNMSLEDERGKLYLKYNDGVTNSFPTFKEFTKIYKQVSVISMNAPNSFSITDDKTLDARVSGTATTTTASSGGEAILTDTSADFNDLSPGDRIHNTTDGSMGVIISKISSTVLNVALFNGANNDWTVGDGYVIQPQGRQLLTLDPPSLTAGHTITIEYIQRPAPVYSDYSTFRFPTQYENGIISYAAYLYLYRDDASSKGDKLLSQFERIIARAIPQINDTYNRNRLTVNLLNRR